MSTHAKQDSAHTVTVARPWIPRIIRMFAVPIVLAWIAIVAVLNTVVPQLEKVEQMRAVSMSPNDAP